MTLKKHLILAIVGVFSWLAFYLLGLSSHYFTDWNLADQILLILVTYFSVIPLLGFFVIFLLEGNYLQNSLWMAFYGSVLLFALDFLAVGLIQGNGFSFLISHWYITITYAYVWIILPLIGNLIHRIFEKVKTITR